MPHWVAQGESLDSGEARHGLGSAGPSDSSTSTLFANQGDNELPVKSLRQ